MKSRKAIRFAVIGFMGVVLSFGVIAFLGSHVHGNDKRKTNPQTTSATLPKSMRVYDLEGREHTFGSTANCHGVVMVFLSTECPMCNEAIPRLNKLAAQSKKHGIEFFGVMPDRTVTRLQAKEHSRSYHIAFPILLDSGNALVQLTEATHTPQAFVFDQAGKEIYRGLIDDSSEKLGKKQAPKKHFLADAIQAVANDHRLANSRTEPVGCLIETPDAGAPESSVTFNRDIAPILFANCVSCHREGEVAPFALTSYEIVAKRAKQIAEVIDQRIMPPWRPSPDYGHFANERRLTDAQIQLIQSWAKANVPEGVAHDLPDLPKFPTGWQLGKPDMIVKMPRKFALYAEGPDLYQHFVIPIGLNQDRLIKAVEVHPGNSKIVHHAHMFVDTTGEARRLDELDPSEGYTRFGGHGLSAAAYLGGWNPGATPHFFPPGSGRLMPGNGDAVFQIHYHPSGKPEYDQTEIGIYFAPRDAQQLIADLVIGNVNLLIPAGASDVRFNAEYTTPTNLIVMEIRPHMHLLGKSYQVRAILPSGQEVPIIKIEHWDFNWQDSYVLDPMIRLPAGSKFQIEVVYDNSSKNPSNPSSPPQTVYFGEESTDELSNCAIRVTTNSYDEFQQVVADNAKYWTAEMKKYLDRNMTPDKKARPQPAPVRSRRKSATE